MVGRGRCLSVAKGDGRVWMNSVRGDELLLSSGTLDAVFMCIGILPLSVQPLSVPLKLVCYVN